VNFEDRADLFVDIGARYVVMVTRHLDGYPLWPTNIPNPHMPADYRSSRDLVGDLSAAVRSRGLKLGLYYAGGTDWTFTDEPIRRLTDLLEQGALGEEYARYATAHWRELIDRYHPDVLWNDMGWPAEQDPHEIFAAYYNSVADGVVNDRWTQVTLPDGRLGRDLYLGFIGLAMRLMAQFHRKVPKQVQKNHFDFTTHEYDPPTEPEESMWELTRGWATRSATTPRKLSPTYSTARNSSASSSTWWPRVGTSSSTSVQIVRAGSGNPATTAAGTRRVASDQRRSHL